jgi:hypothetical protein
MRVRRVVDSFATNLCLPNNSAQNSHTNCTPATQMSQRAAPPHCRAKQVGEGARLQGGVLSENNSASWARICARDAKQIARDRQTCICRVRNSRGDSNFASSATPSPLVQTVNKRPTTTTVVSSANPNNIGQSVTFTAIVSGGLTPTGTVTFSVDGVAGAPVNLVNGQASFTTSTLTVGTHKIAATYSGDANFTTSTTPTPLLQNVNTIATTTTVISSVNPSTPNQTVTFTATVAGGGGGLTPTGTVTFSVDGVARPTVNLTNASASFPTATLTLGTHKIVAIYNGDTNFGGSTSAELVQNVQPTTTTLTSSANPSTPGQSVTFTATVSGEAGPSRPLVA